MSVDELDRQLIDLLGQDARMSSATLARKLNTSSTTIRRRIRRLIQDGVLLVAGLADPDKLDLPLSVMIFVNVAPGKLDSSVRTLSAFPETIWVTTVTGRFDIAVFLLFHSTDDLSEFTGKKLSKVDGIKGHETFIVLHTEKGGLVRV